MEDNNMSIKNNIIWNSLGSITYLFFQWVITVFVTRILGYDDAGVFSMALSITNICCCIALFGVRNFQVSDVNSKYSDSTYITARLITCVFSVLICIGFVAIQSYPFEYAICIIIYMLFRANESYVDVLHGIDQKNWRMDIVGKSYLLRGVFMALVSVYIMYRTNNLLFTIVAMTITTCMIAFFYDRKCTFRLTTIKSGVNSPELKGLLLECLPLATYLLMSTAMGSVPRLFLERICGSEKLGIYASIATPTLIVQVFASYIFTPLIGLFAKYLEDQDRHSFIRLFIKTIGMIFGLAILAIAGTLLFGDFALQLLYGKTILEYTYLLLPIILCTILTAFSWFLCMILTVMREMKGLLIGNLIGIIINLLGSSCLIKYYDMNGASYSLILSFVVQIWILLWYIISKLRCDWKSFAKIS